MSIGICIIAHAPLATALKQCAQHIFSSTEAAVSNEVFCFDVPHDVDVSAGIAQAESMVETLLQTKTGVLVFTDVLGATPSNIAHKLLSFPNIRVLAGVNVPSLIATLEHVNEPLCNVAALAEGAARSGISTAIRTPGIHKE